MSSDARDFGREVWAPHASEGFVRGRLEDIGADSLTVQTDAGPVVAPYDRVFPAEDDGKQPVDDNCALMYLNEATLLDNCRRLYANKKIYSYVANILISINPYESIDGLYSPETCRAYRGKSLGQMPPHVYAIADKAYREMKRCRESQSVIVSGESGAGKTESQKAILRFLCENWGADAGPIQQRLLETNPILEAFGNAKTMRNNNSSRFGKFVEIHFGANHSVAGGFVSHYLLEKSRLCRQSEGERNYHIFYQLIAGADDAHFASLRLASPDKFNYLKHGSTHFFGPSTPAGRSCSEPLSDPMVDDARDFARLTSGLAKLGLTQDEVYTVFRTVAAVLHLGNISFEENSDDMRGGCSTTADSDAAIEAAAEMLGLEAGELRIGLITRIMQATKGGVKGTIIRVPLKVHEACAARDALAKAIYSRLFDWIVSSINKCIPFGQSASYIGVLDIAGFEFFGVNSFEQFCINYCNEKLQHFFNERILKQEQELYEKEGLNVARIEYQDNADCIDLFEMKGVGLLDLLDEEARLPRPSPMHYTQAVHQHHQKHFRLETPRRSKLKEHRDMRDDEGLMVRHYAGSVVYQTARFLDKNNDSLHASLEGLVDTSSVAFLRDLFAVSEETAPRKGGRLVAASVGSKFRAQLVVLLDKLRNTGTHFVRCVKPNGAMQPGVFDGSSILSQLQCAGMGSVLRLMQQGYPSRTAFADLYDMYKTILPPQLASLDPRLFCKCLFRALGLDGNDFKFGLTKVFFRPGKFAEFDQLLRQDPAEMAALVGKVKTWLIQTRWRKAIYGAWSVIKLKNKLAYRRERIVLLQSRIRAFLTRRRFLPRLAVYRQAMSLHERLAEMTEVSNRLAEDSRARWTGETATAKQQTTRLISDIRTEDIDVPTAIARYEECVKEVDRVIVQLKKQAECDETAALEALQRAREEEEQRVKKEQEEKARKEQEEREEKEKERIRRRELEEQRLAEQAEHERRREEMEQEEQTHREQRKEQGQRAEQERLDRAIAERVAAETGQTVEQPMLASSSSASSGNNNTGGGKFNMGALKYADLRDIINTSTDVELLMACKVEFHRRLSIYKEWKGRNKAANQNDDKRLPLAVLQQKSAVAPAQSRVNPALSAQRFFKVPFSRPADLHKNPNALLGEQSSAGVAQNGLWYAHFNGQWVSRQIELHPNKKPMLLVAGKDDMAMCELPLDQTGLTRKKGAEILETEFETMWAHLGGKPLPKWTP